MGSSSSHQEVSAEEPIVFELNFPADILIEVLSFVPAKDLLENCVLVCQEWRHMIEGHGVWKRKCIREGKTIPSWTFDDIPSNYYRNIFLCNPFGRNLLQNPCGENEFDGWEITDGGDGFAIENPPKGADPVPKEVGSQSCFATSFHECCGSQLISLDREKIPNMIMDKLKPEIVVGEWYAARFDCGSVYEFTVVLYNQDNEELDSFTFEHREQQWTGKAWSHVTHTFKNYPSGVRAILFQHAGNDTQFWAGRYGSKMTGSYIKFKFS